MKSIMNFSNILSPALGHWNLLPSGKISYMIGSFHDSHPHKKLHETTSNIKDLKKILVHGLESEHYDDGSYRIINEKIKHGKLHDLAKQMTKKLHQDHESSTSAMGNLPCKTFTFGSSNVKVQIINDDGTTLIIVREANHHPVVCEIAKYGKDTKEEALRIAGEYLAHEHHRASLAIHGNGIITHAPDHIMFNASPLEYWPVYESNIFFNSPNLAFLEHTKE